MEKGAPMAKGPVKTAMQRRNHLIPTGKTAFPALSDRKKFTTSPLLRKKRVRADMQASLKQQN
jgi:hypothetical protein